MPRKVRRRRFRKGFPRVVRIRNASCPVRFSAPGFMQFRRRPSPFSEGKGRNPRVARNIPPRKPLFTERKVSRLRNTSRNRRRRPGILIGSSCNSRTSGKAPDRCRDCGFRKTTRSSLSRDIASRKDLRFQTSRRGVSSFPARFRFTKAFRAWL